MIENLLEPGKIGTMALKNKIIYSAMDLRSTDGQGHMSVAAIDSLVYRAKQPYSPGLIIFPGLFAWHIPGIPYGVTLNLGDDDTVLRLRKAVKKVKINGVKIMAQLYSRGTRVGGGATVNTGPSDLKFGFDPYPTRALSLQEIAQRVQYFGDAALRAREAGFDAVEIHACTGKLINMFLSPYSNRREDQYGGNIENGARFLIEILQDVRQKAGDDFTISVRLGVDDLLGKYGLTLAGGKKVAQLIAPYVDAIQPSIGTQEHIWNITPSYFYEYGYMLSYTEEIKKCINKPIIAMGKLGEPDLAESVISRGQADFVSLGRPLLVDPLWIEKAAKGESARIRKCIGCVNCFTFNARKDIVPTQVTCTLNPELLREADYTVLKLADKVKNILVIGGGPAGMEAAIMAQQRGHHVTLCEKNAYFGGQWAIAAHAHYKKDYKTLIPLKIHEMKEAGVEALLNVTVDKAYLTEKKLDAIILATGAVPKDLSFGYPLGKVNLVQGNDVLMEKAETGKKVVVIGGRYIGLEVALKLSEQGKHVSVVDMQDLGVGANPRIIGIYRDKLVKNGVFFYPNCAVLKFTDEGVDIVHMNSMLTLEADSIVLSIGTKPQNELCASIEALKIPYYCIGDCKRIGDALYAIRDGAEIGRAI